jgi:hypothetical protein
MWGKERRNGKAITFSKTRLPQPALEIVKEAESSTFSPAFYCFGYVQPEDLYTKRPS